mmetsp:Transcript_25233/g.54536  ORF Transcript_25233/g.54536 Transcript_25233/m.54536 type:complete len:270 (-) Transcript_25233:82-891(-)
MTGAKFLPLALVTCLSHALSASVLASQRFVIMRHGQTDANAAGVIQGSSDFSRLSESGQRQARKAGGLLACAFPASPFARVVVSPLNRANHTLSLVRQSVSLPSEEVMHDLREIDLWGWEGKSKKELQTADAVNYAAWKRNPLDMRIDGHRPIRELWHRAHKIWYALRQAEPEVSDGSSQPEKSCAITLIVCHNGIGQAMLGAAIGEDERFFRRHEFPNCGAVELEWSLEESNACRWRWCLPEFGPWQDVTPPTGAASIGPPPAAARGE